MRRYLTKSFVLKGCLLGFLCFSLPFQKALADNTYGFSLGATYLNYAVDGIDRSSLNRGTGIYAGFFGEVPLAGSLYWVPGIFYAKKIGAGPVPVTLVDSISTSANFIEITGNVRWYFWNSPNWRSYLSVGPGFGILLSANQNLAGVDTEITNSMARNDLSYQLGFGLEFPFSSTVGMQLGFSYFKTFTNNLDSKTGSNSESHWEGFYGVASWRFKNNIQEIVTERERAEEYLRYKKSNWNSRENSSDSDQEN